MKKGLYVLFSCIIVLLLSAPGYCETGLYVGGHIGASSLGAMDYKNASYLGYPRPIELDTKLGYTVGGAVGYDLGFGRIEGEISYQSSKMDVIATSGVNVIAGANLEGQGTSLNGFINLYYDYHYREKYTPYLVVGAGYAKIEQTDINFEDSPLPDDPDIEDTVLGYHMGFGLGIDMTERLTLDIKFRYFFASDVEDAIGAVALETDWEGVNGIIGLRYRF